MNGHANLNFPHLYPSLRVSVSEFVYVDGLFLARRRKPLDIHREPSADDGVWGTEEFHRDQIKKIP